MKTKCLICQKDLKFMNLRSSEIYFCQTNTSWNYSHYIYKKYFNIRKELIDWFIARQDNYEISLCSSRLVVQECWDDGSDILYENDSGTPEQFVQFIDMDFLKNFLILQ